MKYHIAYICTKGYIVSDESKFDGQFCPKCGSDVIHQCQNCHTDIKGREILDNAYNWEPIRLSYYCTNCSTPYP